jgi:gas vesicle protein
MSRSLGLVVAGAAVGALVGLLLAPQPGRHTRALVREKAVKLTSDVSDLSRSQSRRLVDTVIGYRQKLYKTIGDGHSTEAKIQSCG